MKIDDLIECIFNSRSGEYTDDFNMGINSAANKMRDLLRDNRPALEASIQVPLRFEKGIGLDCKPEWHLIGTKNQIVQCFIPREDKSMDDVKKHCEIFATSLGHTAEFKS